MRNEAWSKIQFHGNLELKNLMALYTLTLRKILEHFMDPLYTYYISFRSSGSQESNASNGLQIEAEMNKLWPFENNCTKLEGHFEIQLMNLKSNLWIQNPIRNYPNFEFTHYHFDVSPHLPRELHLEHSIHPKWALHD